MTIEEKHGKRGSVARRAFTVDEVSKMLAVSKRSLWRQIAQKHIKVFRIGRCVRVPETEVNKLIGSEVQHG